MGRLKALPPRVGGLSPRLAKQTDEHGHSRDAEPWRKWYSTARWARTRQEVFERDDYACQWKGCGRIEADTSRLRCDHIEPHRGDEALFWDRRNLQTLCVPCHDSRKQALEKRWPRFT